jgi:hypothetical protein
VLLGLLHLLQQLSLPLPARCCTQLLLFAAAAVARTCPYICYVLLLLLLLLLLLRICRGALAIYCLLTSTCSQQLATAAAATMNGQPPLTAAAAAAMPAMTQLGGTSTTGWQQKVQQQEGLQGHLQQDLTPQVRFRAWGSGFERLGFRVSSAAHMHLSAGGRPAGVAAAAAPNTSGDHSVRDSGSSLQHTISKSSLNSKQLACCFAVFLQILLLPATVLAWLVTSR